MEKLLQLSNRTLLFPFNVLLCSLLCPFCLDAEEPGIGMGHVKTGKSLDSGFFLFVHIPGGITGPVAVWTNLRSSAELSPFFGVEGFLGTV